MMNFDSIAIISSSFGDELIAKLVIDIGIDKFKSRFSFANINDTVFMLIDKSVQQRLIKSDKARPITSVDALWR